VVSGSGRGNTFRNLIDEALYVGFTTWGCLVTVPVPQIVSTHKSARGQHKEDPVVRRVVLLLAAACLAIAGGCAAVASAAPPPKLFDGAKLSVFASGLKNPTSFAFGDGQVFAGDSGGEQKVPNGGVYVLKAGSATKIPKSPVFVGGMEFHNGVLYMSGAVLSHTGPKFQILAWSGWNGKTFMTRKVLYTAPAKFQGFDGLAFGPNGRLYVGVAAGLLNSNDHGPASLSPYLYDILSMDTSGKGLKVFATGIRQPWQLAFAPGSSSPFVSDLGQDGPKSVKDPPDFLLKVSQGQNYGFPGCSHTKGSPCASFAKPFASFAPHSDIMGVAVSSGMLYVGSFAGMGGRGGGALYAVPISGGEPKPVVTGLEAATDALAAHDGYLYIGGSTQKGAGYVYRVKP
jgi:glucose/arabinose dehydrogenase